MPEEELKKIQKRKLDRKRKPKLKFSSKIFYISLFAISIYCFFRIVETSLDVAAKQVEYENLVQQLQEQQQTNAELEALIDSNKDAIIERSAREEYDYVYPTERVFIDMGGK